MTGKRGTISREERGSNAPGGVAERLKAPVLKTGKGRQPLRGFESHPHRFDRPHGPRRAIK